MVGISRRGFFPYQVFLYLSVFCFIFSSWPKGSHASEVRAVWVHPERQFDGNQEKGEQQIQEFIRRLSKANINLILPWVRSEYIAALTDPEYAEKISVAKWDAVGQLVKAAHREGIQTHIWYSFTYYKSPNSPEFNPKHGGNPQWAARRLDELVADSATSKIKPRRMQNVCPLNPDARRWELQLIEKMLNLYPLVSGVHIEEPGYSGKGNCVCDLCSKVFKLVYGGEIANEIQSMKAQDLRCTATTAFMRQLQKMIAEKYPKLILSTNGAWNWHSDRHSGRNWKHWAEFGWLNFYVPQIYTSDMNDFQTRARATIDDLGKDCAVVVGIAVEWGGGNKNSTETVINQIAIARKLGAGGVVFFHGKALTDELLQALKAGPFKERAPLF